MQTRKALGEGAALAAAVVAGTVTYGILAVHPAGSEPVAGTLQACAGRLSLAGAWSRVCAAP
jgi:hypothetical protein